MSWLTKNGLWGDYTLHFGWRVEPAATNLPNGLEVFIADTDGNPIEGAELTAVATFGSETTTIQFRQAWQEPGHYITDLIPTMPGDYSFQLTGTIGDTEIDEVFTSADGQFSTVEPSADLMFPSSRALEQRIADLEARIAALEALIAELQGE